MFKFIVNKFKKGEPEKPIIEFSYTPETTEDLVKQIEKEATIKLGLRELQVLVYGYEAVEQTEKALQFMQKTKKTSEDAIKKYPEAMTQYHPSFGISGGYSIDHKVPNAKEILEALIKQSETE